MFVETIRNAIHTENPSDDEAMLAILLLEDLHSRLKVRPGSSLVEVSEDIDRVCSSLISSRLKVDLNSKRSVRLCWRFLLKKRIKYIESELDWLYIIDCPDDNYVIKLIGALNMELMEIENKLAADKASSSSE